MQHLRVDGSDLGVKSGGLAARLEQRFVEARRSALEEVEERSDRAGAGPAAEREAARAAGLRLGGEQPEQRESALQVGAAVEERGMRLAREHLLVVVRRVGHRLRIRVDAQLSQLRLQHHRRALVLVGRVRRAIAFVLLAAAILFTGYLFTDIDTTTSTNIYRRTYM